MVTPRSRYASSASSNAFVSWFRSVKNPHCEQRCFMACRSLGPMVASEYLPVGRGCQALSVETFSRSFRLHWCRRPSAETVFDEKRAETAVIGVLALAGTQDRRVLGGGLPGHDLEPAAHGQ